MAKIAIRNLAVAIVLFASCVSLSRTAEAGDWIYKKEEKAFGAIDATAMAVGDESVAFVRCDDGELGVSLATPEDWKDSSAGMNALSPQIIMAVDGSEPFKYAATLGENGMHKFLASIEDEALAKEAVQKMIAAKKKIEIGIEIGGKRFYASKLSAAGASKKLQSVLDTCASKEEAEAKSDEKK